MRVRQLVHTGAAALLAACGTGFITASDDALRAVATRSELRLTNVSATPVFVAVIGREAAPLADIFPCVLPACPPPIAPGDTRTVPRPTYEGRREREATVEYWRAGVDSAGAPRATGFGRLGVRFP